MAASRVEPGFDHERLLTDRNAAHGLAPDLSRVLVVGNSQINRIVVAKIVERAGLKAVCEQPASAVRVLPQLFPGMVVLDGGADNRECDAVIPGIQALRLVSAGGFPSVILLSNRTGPVAATSLAALTDAIVTKPFTVEQLQPVINRLAGSPRR